MSTLAINAFTLGFSTTTIARSPIARYALLFVVLGLPAFIRENDPALPVAQMTSLGALLVQMATLAGMTMAYLFGCASGLYYTFGYQHNVSTSDDSFLAHMPRYYRIRLAEFAVLAFTSTATALADTPVAHGVCAIVVGVLYGLLILVSSSKYLEEPVLWFSATQDNESVVFTQHDARKLQSHDWYIPAIAQLAPRCVLLFYTIVDTSHLVTLNYLLVCLFLVVVALFAGLLTHMTSRLEPQVGLIRTLRAVVSSNLHNVNRDGRYFRVNEFSTGETNGLVEDPELSSGGGGGGGVYRVEVSSSHEF